MYERTCVGCFNHFTTLNYQQKRCRKDCSRPHGKRPKRRERELRFVGVDGEGVDRPDGKHEYVMLSVGNRTLFESGNALTSDRIFEHLYTCFQDDPEAVYVGFFLGYDFIQWEKGLPERAAWYLLTSEGIVKRKSNVKGGSPYPDPVVWGKWEFDVLAGRRWKLRPHIHRRSNWSRTCRNRTCDFEYEEASFPDERPDIVPMDRALWIPASGTFTYSDSNVDITPEFWDRMALRNVSTTHKDHSSEGKWMYICDTGPFWQQSFLKVVEPSAWGDDPVCSEEEYAILAKGKADRGLCAEYGDESYRAEMERYNVFENRVLARVTGRLNSGFRNEHIPIYIPPKDWYGPGRAAQIWMDQLSEKIADVQAVEHNRVMRRNPNMGLVRKNEYTLRNADVYAEMPEWAQLASQRTYYGGWFEQMAHGHVGSVHEYDINSAYPFVIASLPCLHTTGSHTGAWSRGTTDVPLSVPYVIVHARVFGSNPYIGSMPHRDSHGNIRRPNNVEGWYWLHELQASVRAGLTDSWEPIEYVAYEPCSCPPPFNDPDIGIERMYNLRLLVGKNTPQGKGFKLVYNSAYGKTAQSIGNPKYSNPLYASLITAGCRAQILNAIASHPMGAEAVSMVATDGVYFTSPHPSLNLSPSQLGAWDGSSKEHMTQLMPGVYWDDTTRSRIQGGLPPSLKSRGINARDLAASIQELDTAFDDLMMDVVFGRELVWPELKLTQGFVLDSAKSALRRGKWQIAGRVTHGKQRSISSDPKSKRDPATVHRDGNLIRTRPYTAMPEPSIGYDKTFGYAEYLISQQEAEYVDLDGRDELDWFRDLLRGD